MSSATWSLRLRPVCSLAPVAPAISVTRRSIAVWMSSSVGANANVALDELLLDARERGGDHLALLLVEQADAFEHVHVRARSREVVAREPAVVRQADREREQLVGGAFAEPPGPERLPGCFASVRLGSLTAAPGPWRRDHVCADRPHSRTKPFGVLVAERVLGVVGREVVVVETARRAPADRAALSRPRAAAAPRRSRRFCVSVTNACSARISGECHRPS